MNTGPQSSFFIFLFFSRALLLLVRLVKTGTLIERNWQPTIDKLVIEWMSFIFFHHVKIDTFCLETPMHVWHYCGSFVWMYVHSQTYIHKHTLLQKDKHTRYMLYRRSNSSSSSSTNKWTFDYTTIFRALQIKFPIWIHNINWLTQLKLPINILIYCI